MDYRNYSIGDQPAKERYADEPSKDKYEDGKYEGQSTFDGPANPFAVKTGAGSPASENARPMTATEVANKARLRASAKQGIDEYESRMAYATLLASATVVGLGLPQTNAKFIADAAHHFEEAFAALRKACDLA